MSHITSPYIESKFQQFFSFQPKEDEPYLHVQVTKKAQVQNRLIIHINIKYEA